MSEPVKKYGVLCKIPLEFWTEPEHLRSTVREKHEGRKRLQALGAEHARRRNEAFWKAFTKATPIAAAHGTH